MPLEYTVFVLLSETSIKLIFSVPSVPLVFLPILFPHAYQALALPNSLLVNSYL